MGDSIGGFVLHRHRLQNVVFFRLQVNHDSHYTSIPCVSLPLLPFFGETTVWKGRRLKAHQGTASIDTLFFCLHDSFTGITGKEVVKKATNTFLYEQREFWQLIARPNRSRLWTRTKRGVLTGMTPFRRRRSRASYLEEKPILQEQMVACWRLLCDTICEGLDLAGSQIHGVRMCASSSTLAVKEGRLPPPEPWGIPPEDMKHST